MQLLALITLHNAFQAVLSARCGRLFLSLRHHCKPSLPLILPATYYVKKRVVGICDAYKQVTMERITQFPIPALVQVIHPFLLLRASRPGLCSDLSAGESCPLRILPRSLSAGELRLPPLISLAKDGGLPPVASDKTV